MEKTKMLHNMEVQVGEVAGQVAHLDQFFGPWAVEETTFSGLFSCVGKMNLAAHVATSRERVLSSSPERFSQSASAEFSLALVRMTGPMTKYGSSLTGPGSLEVRKQIQSATRDPEVGGILLVIDSPGGSVHGTGDLAAEVARAAEKKPVYAFIEDLGCSAAYWVASQATKVYCNASARVGSIGTFLVLYDSSAMAEKSGVRAVVIRAGSFKGAGVDGAPITEEQEAEFQRLVNECNDQFLSSVASGRRVSRETVTGWADGRAHGSSAAVAMGLVDAISTQDGVLADLIAACAGRKSQRKGGSRRMDAATFAEIKGSLPTASADFIVRQLEKGASLEQVQGAFQAEQESKIVALEAQASDLKGQIVALEAQNADLKGQIEDLKKVPKGLAPVASDGSVDAGEASSDPVSAWNTAVKSEMGGGKSQKDAVLFLARERPDLHRAYLDQVNLKP
jgi:signal peptide peptidase SppA